MRFIRRLDLSQQTLRLLAQRAEKVRQAEQSKNEALRLWKSRSNQAFDEIRERLRQMASGLERCMYCEDNAGTDIEHFYPKSQYPERAFDWNNYLHACSHCNSNEKRTQFPVDLDGRPLLIDPTAEDPLEHLRFSPKVGKFRWVTPKGKASVEVFGLERPTLVQGRANAWTKMSHLLKGWGDLKERGHHEEAFRVKKVLVEEPFSAVFAILVRMSKGPQPEVLIRGEVLAVLKNYPEIQAWLD